MARRIGDRMSSLVTTALFAQTESRYFANSEASALALCEALSGAVAFRAKNSLRAAAGLADAVLPWLHTEASARAGPGKAAPSQRRSLRGVPPGAQRLVRAEHR